MSEVEHLNARDGEAWVRLARHGRFEQAWRLSDRIRMRTPNRSGAAVPRHLQQIWDGTPLQGRRVLVRCYHGLGDTIQFIRFARQLHSIAREVSVWCQTDLMALVATAQGVDRVVLASRARLFQRCDEGGSGQVRRALGSRLPGR